MQECLRYSEEAAKKVGPRYAITTFGFGLYMKAYLLIWKNPERYKDHIFMIRSFHVICAYLKMVGEKKWMAAVIWRNPERYKDHTFIIGSFHGVCLVEDGREKNGWQQSLRYPLRRGPHDIRYILVPYKEF